MLNNNTPGRHQIRYNATENGKTVYDIIDKKRNIFWQIIIWSKGIEL